MCAQRARRTRKEIKQIQCKNIKFLNKLYENQLLYIHFWVDMNQKERKKIKKNFLRRRCVVKVKFDYLKSEKLTNMRPCFYLNSKRLEIKSTQLYPISESFM